MIGDKNLPQQKREMLKAEKEVTKVIKAEAIKGGLTPEQAQDVIKELTEEKIVSDNIEKLSEFHEGKEFAVDELEEVLSGKRPTKDKDGQIKFTEPVSIKNTKVATVSQDVTLNADNLESKKEALKSKWREFLAEAGDLGISFFVPVAGPPTGAAFSQVVKGERDDTKSLEGLAWGAADLTIAGMIKKVKTGGKLVSMVPKGVKLVEETKDLMKVKAVKQVGWQEHHIIPKMLKEHEVIKKAALDIESKVNKMRMPSKKGLDPTSSLHRGGPSKDAIERIEKAMDSVLEQGKSEGWKQQQYLNELEDIIAKERSGLSSGKFKLNNAG